MLLNISNDPRMGKEFLGRSYRGKNKRQIWQRKNIEVMYRNF